jgi:Zn-dependent protease
VSDPSHWWPGGRESSSGPEGPGTPGGTSVPPSAGPYGGGGYYYPPGTTPGQRQTNGGAPVRQRRPASPHTTLWIVIAVVVAIILVSSHRITRDEVVLFCVIVPSIILHEIAHGWVALVFGDDTAKRAGRLTLNPIAHIDIFGTLILPLLMIWGGWGFFGYAKPVPVNVAKLRSPRNHGVLVALAGPATNVVLVALSAVAFHLFGGVQAVRTSFETPLWVLIVVYLGLVNIWLAAFNLIPIPPLDGSVLIERLIPSSWWPGYLNLRRYAMPVLLIAVLLASSIHDGNTSLINHFRLSTENWWTGVLGLN